MKEPKAIHVTLAYKDDGDINTYRFVYSKSEADRYIAWLKYKRCVAIERWCDEKEYINEAYPDTSSKESFLFHYNFYPRWRERWHKLAKHYKEMAK